MVTTDLSRRPARRAGRGAAVLAGTALVGIAAGVTLTATIIPALADGGQGGEFKASPAVPGGSGGTGSAITGGGGGGGSEDLSNEGSGGGGGGVRLTNGISLIGKFDGEFASGSQTYAGTGTLRYQW